MKVIRLTRQIKVGREVHPQNAVFEATDEVADALIEAECARPDDCTERYPIGQPLTRVDEFPFGWQPPIATPLHIDRIVQKRIDNA